MDANWQPTQGSDAARAGGVDVGTGIVVDVIVPASAPVGWRAELLPDARGRIVAKIWETLKNQLPGPAPAEALNHLQTVSVRFEEKIYNLATDLPDYLRRISMKMLHLANQRAGEIAPPVIPNANNLVPAPAALPPHGLINQQQPPAVPLMPQQQNIYAFAQAYPFTGNRQILPGAYQPSMPQNVPAGAMPQNVPAGAMPQNVPAGAMPQNTMYNNGLPQGAPQNIHAVQRQIAGMQQQQQQQQQPHNQIIYQPQQQQVVMRQNLQQGAVIQPRTQQRGFIQARRARRQVRSGASVDSTARTGLAGADDWREETYQMLKNLKYQYYADLIVLYEKILAATAPSADVTQRGYETMKKIRPLLERVFNVITLNRSGVQPGMREKVPLLEKQILRVLRMYREWIVPPTVGGDGGGGGGGL